MAPVLRKRKAPAPPPEPPAKKQSKATKAADKVKEVKQKVVAKAAALATNGKAAAAKKAPATAVERVKAPEPANKLEVGSTVSLDGFGGEIQKNDGTKTTLKALVDESKAGVVLFTYPKASTPGCTKQACLFRDAYTSLTSTGLAIYGLSPDSPKANTNFKDKQKLPYPLLCDPGTTLLAAIHLKNGPGKASRGAFVVDKTGKILAAQTGSPPGTVAVVKKIVEGMGASEEEVPVESEEKEEEQAEEAKDKENDEKAEAEEKPAEEAVAEKKDVETAEVPNGEGEEKKED